jgi:hypothetical protein
MVEYPWINHNDPHHHLAAIIHPGMDMQGVTTDDGLGDTKSAANRRGIEKRKMQRAHKHQKLEDSNFYASAVLQADNARSLYRVGGNHQATYLARINAHVVDTSYAVADAVCVSESLRDDTPGVNCDSDTDTDTEVVDDLAVVTDVVRRTNVPAG